MTVMKLDVHITLIYNPTKNKFLTKITTIGQHITRSARDCEKQLVLKLMQRMATICDNNKIFEKVQVTYINEF